MLALPDLAFKTGLMDAFDILGIPHTANASEISAAWKRLALISHPDMHPNATPEQKQMLSARMAEINAAHEVLQDPLARDQLIRARTLSLHEDEPVSPGHARPDNRSSNRVGGCDLCSATPTRPLVFKQVTGQIFRDLVRTIDAQFCRDCGIAVGREMQSRTILTGWWGVFAIFRNFGAIFSNAKNLYWASQLNQPVQLTNSAFRSLPIGKSVFARPRTWFGLGAVALVLIWSVTQNNGDQTGSTSPRSEYSRTTSAEVFRVGSCVSGFSLVSAVRCSSPHTGKIVATASSPSGCPYSAEKYLDEVGFVYCVDEDQ